MNLRTLKLTSIATAAFICAAILGAPAARAADPDLSTPFKTVSAFADAFVKGDPAGMKATCTNIKEQDAKIFDVLAGAASAFNKLQAAADAKFGADAKVFADESPASAMKEMLDKAQKNLKEEGDTAKLPRGDGDPSPVLLKKIDGKWLLDFTSLHMQDDPVAASKEMQSLTKCMLDGAADIAAGKYKTAAEAKEGIEKQMREGDKK